MPLLADIRLMGDVMRGTSIVAIVLCLMFGASADAAEAAKPGHFDSLVLSLAWSPTWCASPSGQSDKQQCGDKKFGFIAHGLWPQMDQGANPAKCAEGDDVPEAVAAKIRTLMPSRKLIDNEWRRHGTCFGGDAAGYFAKVKAAWDKVTIPAIFAAPDKTRSDSADKIRQAFVAANPGLPAEAVRVTCRKQRGEGEHPVRLADVRICLDKDLKFRACTGRFRESCQGAVEILPVK